RQCAAQSRRHVLGLSQRQGAGEGREDRAALRSEAQGPDLLARSEHQFEPAASLAGALGRRQREEHGAWMGAFEEARQVRQRWPRREHGTDFINSMSTGETSVAFWNMSPWKKVSANFPIK